MREMSASEKAMLQARRHAGLDGGGFHEEEPAPVADPFAVLTDLLKAVADGKSKQLLADLAKQSADAKAATEKVAKDRQALDDRKATEEVRWAVERERVTTERREHDQFVAAERAKITEEHKAATADRQAAAARAEGEAFRTEQRRRLTAIEKIVNG